MSTTAEIRELDRFVVKQNTDDSMEDWLVELITEYNLLIDHRHTLLDRLEAAERKVKDQQRWLNNCYAFQETIEEAVKELNS